MKEHSLFESLLSIIYPSFCVVCGEKTENAYPLCEDCERKVREVQYPYCRVCGKPMPSLNITVCGGCLTHPPPFAMARSGYIYDGVLKEVIHKWKYGGKRSLSRLMNSLLVKAILKSDIPIASIDRIVYVPMSKEKLRRRGFNQTEDMARHLSKTFSIPLYIDLKKKSYIREQALLSKEERLRNIKGAFYLSENLPDIKNILVIDDVYTTGATVREIAKTFVSAKRDINVYIFTLSRGVL